MQRYWDVYKILLRNSLIREMSFKGNFILWMVTELLWFLGQVLFVDVLFLYTDRIGSWSKWEVVLLIGTHQIISQIFQAFCYINLSNLPELVRTGRLDLMLLLPMDAQFSVSTRQFGLDNVVNAGIGLAFVLFSLHGTRGRAHAEPGRVVRGRRAARNRRALFDHVHAGDVFLLDRSGAGTHLRILQPDQHLPLPGGGVWRHLQVRVFLAGSGDRGSQLARADPGEGRRPSRSGRCSNLAFVSALAVGMSRWFWGFALRRYSSASS